MAAPILDPALHRLQQTTSTVASAAKVLTEAFASDPHLLTFSLPSQKKLTLPYAQKTIAVPQPRRKLPVHLLPNQAVQPWELLPLKAAALQQYPNFFNHSCTFFGSVSRDVSNSLPYTLLRPNKLAVDLAKVVTNLGIVAAMELVQKRTQVKKGSPLLPHYPRLAALDAADFQIDALSLRQYDHAYVRLHLRHDMYRPLWDVAEQQQRLAAEEGDAAAESFLNADKSSEISPRPACGHLHASLPTSCVNVSRASRPVMMYPQQVVDKRKTAPSGVYVMYHHQLGLMVDAQAEWYDVPGLVLAHVGLPVSMVAQIRGALRDKAAADRAIPLDQVTQLKDWSLLRSLQSSLDARSAGLAGKINVAGQVAGLVRDAQARAEEVAVAVRKHDVADQLQQELLAWEIVSSGALEAIPSAFTAPQSASGGAASAQAPSRGGQQRPKQPGGGGGSGKGQEAQQKKPQQRNPSS